MAKQDCKKCKGTGLIKDRFIPFSGGSMCMGIAAGVGFALAKKLKGEEGKIYVLESDGGMQGGITWEALAIAAQHKLDNLVVIIDRNWRQAMGKTEDIISMRNLPERFNDFGWHYSHINGHKFSKILESLDSANGLLSDTKAPFAIIADTIKGKGVSFMEGDNIWHYKAPNRDEYERALAELNV